jgi:hypothetical protein
MCDMCDNNDCGWRRRRRRSSIASEGNAKGRRKREEEAIPSGDENCCNNAGEHTHLFVASTVNASCFPVSTL